jgi:hypothetical protein
MPERTRCDADTADLIASWNTIFGSVYTLWLDSGEYEGWAEAELLSTRSMINARAWRLERSCLNTSRPSIYGSGRKRGRLSVLCVHPVWRALTVNMWFAIRVRSWREPAP